MKRLILILILLTANLSYGQIYNISNATQLFVPSYRGQPNTTYFEWADGDFYGFPVPPSSSRILNNTPPSLGITNNVQFYQNDRFSASPVIIGSSAGNIYTGFGANGKQAFASIVVPTLPGLSLGNTTLFIQGKTVPEGGFAPADQLILNYPRFTLNGVSPTFEIGINENREGQWYAQFVVASSNSTFTINVEFPGGANTYPISIANLSVDSLWEPVPEPSTYALLTFCLVLFFISARKWRLQSVSKTEVS